jgi:hypothetical protein
MLDCLPITFGAIIQTVSIKIIFHLQTTLTTASVLASLFLGAGNRFSRGMIGSYLLTDLPVRHTSNCGKADGNGYYVLGL